MKKFILSIMYTLIVMGGFSVNVNAKEITLLNVSYDPTRELYKAYNKMFSEHWASLTGDTVKVNMSHGGSGKQARSVIDGLDADVVTLALSNDIDNIAKRSGLLSEQWQKKLPQNSTPYTSTIVFLVRKGNPKNIQDWDDLAKSGIAVITPNPKTGGGARWNYLAAWGYGLKKFEGDEAKVKELVGKIYKNITVLDPSARASTTTFVERKIGDVLITWENEAYLAINELGKDEFEIIMPSLTILAEPPVTVVERNANRHGNAKVAAEYLNYLYSEEAQGIIAKNFYRPRSEKALAKYTANFKPVKTFTIDEMFGGWAKAQAVHFADKGIFDQIYGN